MRWQRFSFYFPRSENYKMRKMHFVPVLCCLSFLFVKTNNNKQTHNQNRSQEPAAGGRRQAAGGNDICRQLRLIRVFKYCIFVQLVLLLLLLPHTMDSTHTHTLCEGLRVCVCAHWEKYHVIKLKQLSSKHIFLPKF